jgi:tetratricopeptide (TPR) repeat protein
MPVCSQARFNSEEQMIGRLLDQGQLQLAYQQAQALLEKSKALGATAYEGADYDLAMAHWLLGRVLRRTGQAASALALLIEAQQLFEALGEGGDRMAAVTIGQQANCLEDLGRLDQSVEKYQERIKRGEKMGDFRGVMASKSNLAGVLCKQGKYPEAMANLEVTRAFFEQQGEFADVAIDWSKIGNVHESAGHYEEAETAYRQALATFTQMNNRAGQMKTLGQLGVFYDNFLHRPEDALTFYRQAADIAVELKDFRSEGSTCSNIARTFFELQRYDEARIEIRRAIECNDQFGLTAEPWKSFDILHDIETATRNSAAAHTAWQHARDAYLAYRTPRGYAQSSGGELVDVVLGLIAKQQLEEMQSLLSQLANDPDTQDSRKHLIQAVFAILNGSRDSTLAESPALDYHDSAEILYLLQQIGEGA